MLNGHDSSIRNKDTKVTLMTLDSKLTKIDEGLNFQAKIVRV